MIFNTKEIKLALSPLKAAYAPNNLIHFTIGNISTKKDDILISMEIEEDEDLYGSFPMQQFVKILSSITEEKVTLSVVNGNLEIKSKNTMATLAGKDEEITEEVSDILAEMEYEWFESSDTLAASIKMAADVASKDLRDGAISCVSILPDCIEATNNIKAIIIKEQCEVPDRVLINAQSAKKMAITDVSHTSVSENFFHLFSASTRITQTFIRIEEDFPDLKGTVSGWSPKKSNKGQTVIFTQEAIKATKELISFCEGKEDYEKSLRITFNKNNIEFFAQSEEAKISKKIKNDTGISGVEFSISPTTLSNLIADTKCTLIDDKLFFLSKNITYVIGL